MRSFQINELTLLRVANLARRALHEVEGSKAWQLDFEHFERIVSDVRAGDTLVVIP